MMETMATLFGKLMKNIHNYFCLVVTFLIAVLFVMYYFLNAEKTQNMKLVKNVKHVNIKGVNSVFDRR